MNTAARATMVGITCCWKRTATVGTEFGGLDYLLKRSEIDEQDEQPEFGSRRRAAPR